MYRERCNRQRNFSALLLGFALVPYLCATCYGSRIYRMLHRFPPWRRSLAHAACLVALVLLGLGCGQQDEEASSAIPRMSFDVDTTRLGAPVQAADYDVAFRPPAGWALLSSAELDSMSQAGAALSDTAALRPLYVFLDSTQGSVLSVGRLRLDTTATFGEQMQQYGASLQQQFGDTLRQAQFMKDDLYMAQFLAQPEGLVNFKLVFEAPSDDVLQFDYVVPQSVYPQEVRSVESSIGSIRPVQ